MDRKVVWFGGQTIVPSDEPKCGLKGQLCNDGRETVLILANIYCHSITGQRSTVTNTMAAARLPLFPKYRNAHIVPLLFSIIFSQ
jgi:hypothetical protein